MKKLNLITGTGIPSGATANFAVFNSLFEEIKKNGLQFKGADFASSLIESGKTIRELGTSGVELYDFYENYLFFVRSATVLKFLKTENISYKVLNIKGIYHNTFLKKHPFQSESSRMAEKISLEIAEKANSNSEKEYLEAMENTSVFEVLNISVDELEGKFAEIVSFFKN